MLLLCQQPQARHVHLLPTRAPAGYSTLPGRASTPPLGNPPNSQRPTRPSLVATAPLPLRPASLPLYSTQTDSETHLKPIQQAHHAIEGRTRAGDLVEPRGLLLRGLEVRVDVRGRGLVRGEVRMEAIWTTQVVVRWSVHARWEGRRATNGVSFKVDEFDFAAWSSTRRRRWDRLPSLERAESRESREVTGGKGVLLPGQTAQQVLLFDSPPTTLLSADVGHANLDKLRSSQWRAL